MLGVLKKIRVLLDPLEAGIVKKTVLWAVNILLMLAWSAGLGLMSLYYAAISYGLELFHSYFENIYIIAANIMPVVWLTALTFFVTNRVWISFLSTSAIILIPTFLNYNKLILRGDPLVAKDIALIPEAANIGLNYNLSIDRPGIICVVAVSLIILVSAAFLRARLKGKKGIAVRAVASLILLALGVLAGLQIYARSEFYHKTENIDVALESRTLSQWSATDQYVTRGFIYPLIYSAKRLYDPAPKGFDEQLAQAEYESYEKDDIPNDKKVSVIAIMLEAYADFSDFLELETDPYEYMHKLEKEAVSGELVTNVFAGDTINTELSFITGNSNYYDYRIPTQSFARYFISQGYKTEFCHPGDKWFYNRGNVHEYLGFENRWFRENRYFTADEEIIQRDSEFFDDIITLFESSIDEGKPYFNFSVSYQNHGPYYAEAYWGEYEFLSHEGISRLSYNVVNNYYEGIKWTDDAIRDFVEYFRKSSEPVILTFFGDHKPWMGDGSSVYLELGYNLDLSTSEGFYNYYSTPYVIWANDSAKDALGKSFEGDGKSFSPMFLMAEIFDQAGWGGDEFIKAQRELMTYIDVIHAPSGLVRENGELTDSPSKEAVGKLDKFMHLQYYRRRIITPEL